MSRVSLVLAAFLTAPLALPTPAGAQTVDCSPAAARSSLVRIERPRRPPGTGVVIAKNDDFAIVVTAKHVLENPILRPPEEFTVSFPAAPNVRVPVTWDDDTVFGWSRGGDRDNLDIAIFRVNAPIPTGVSVEDPFFGDISVGGSIVAWGYPASGNGALCSYAGRIRSIGGGEIVADIPVPPGVSGGPMFLQDPDGAIAKLIGLVVRGDTATTAAIDVSQVAGIVRTSLDPRNKRRPHIWPNIRLQERIQLAGLRDFHLVKAGPFTMGSNFRDEKWPEKDGGRKGEKIVTLPDFYMAKFEVTVDQYRECVKVGPPNGCTHIGVKESSPMGDHPVTGVSWYEASAYARWLQQTLRRRQDTPLLLQRLLEANWEIVLPNEPEWEKAARHDGTGAYPWKGNNAKTNLANYGSDVLKAVGEMRCETQCVYALEDMAGNVREWTRSLKQDYPFVAGKADEPAATAPRAVRGGSFEAQPGNVEQDTIRATNRQQADPSHMDKYTGFRVALICRPESKCSWRAPD